MGELEGVPDPDCAAVVEPLKEALPVLEEEAPVVREAVGDGDTVLLPVSVEVLVGAGVPVPVAVGDADGVHVPLCVGVPLLLHEVLAVLDADAPAVTEDVGDTETVLLLLTVELAVGGGVPVDEGVGVTVGVPVLVCEGVAELEREALPLLEGDTPLVRDAVGEDDCVLLPLTVGLAVAAPVPLPVGEAVLVGEEEGVEEPVSEAVMETVPVLEAEAPRVTVAVGLEDTVPLPLSVEEGVKDGVPLPVAVGEPDGVPVPLCDGVAQLLRDWLAVLEGDAPAVTEAVGDEERVLLPLAVVLGVNGGVPVGERVGELEGVPDPVFVAVAELL